MGQMVCPATTTTTTTTNSCHPSITSATIYGYINYKQLSNSQPLLKKSMSTISASTDNQVSICCTHAQSRTAMRTDRLRNVRTVPCAQDALGRHSKALGRHSKALGRHFAGSGPISPSRELLLLLLPSNTSKRIAIRIAPFNNALSITQIIVVLFILEQTRQLQP